jgi:thiol:disulfide interchange protein DsbD
VLTVLLGVAGLAWGGSRAFGHAQDRPAAAAKQPAGVTLKQRKDTGDGEQRAEAEILIDKARVKPGEAVTIGVRFRVQKGWHLYWPGLNDSGDAPRWSFQELPAGLELGEVLWPVPTRHVSEGDILDHILEGDVTILVRGKISASAKPGPRKAAVRLKWVACSDVCVSEYADTALAFEVVGSDAEVGEGSEPAWLRSARERLASELTGEAGVRLLYRRGYFVAEASGAEGLAFFPLIDGVAPLNTLRECVVEGDRLRVKMSPRAAGVEEARVRGVLEVRRKKAEQAPSTPAKEAVSWYVVDVGPDSASSAGGEGAGSPEKE